MVTWNSNRKINKDGDKDRNVWSLHEQMWACIKWSLFFDFLVSIACEYCNNVHQAISKQLDACFLTRQCRNITTYTYTHSMCLTLSTLSPSLSLHLKVGTLQNNIHQWEFQDPKMEVLYHIRPYFVGYIPLHRPYIDLICGRYVQFRFLRWPVNSWP